MTTKRIPDIRILGTVVLFLAVLTVLIASAAPAQQTDTGQPSAKTSATSVPMHNVGQEKLGAAAAGPATPLFLPAVTYTVDGPNGATSVSVGDVNLDGNLDLVATNQGTPVSVLLGNGDGTFQPAMTYDTGAVVPQAVVVTDVNGDGKPDLIVAGLYGGVGVLLGNGDGTFKPVVMYSDIGGWDVAVADINGDGKPDLIAANQASVAVALGNGDGTFQRAVSYYSGGYQAVHVAVADVNGDGRPDLVVANECVDLSHCPGPSGTVGVLLGNGDGTFQPTVIYDSGGAQAFSVAVADLNGDGKLDLVVVNQASFTLGVLRGNGDGTFQPAVIFNVSGESISSVAIADVDGDGKPDLLVAISAPAGGEVGVLLGNGDGTFQPVVTYGSGSWSGAANSQALAVADVNRDGKLDVAIANFGSNTVGVLLNNSGRLPPGPFAYVTNSNSSSVSVIDTSTNSVTTTIGVQNRPIGVAFTPDGTRVYVANSSSNSVSVIDTTTNTVVATIPDPSFPQGLAITPDGSRVYTANSGSNNVAVIDTASNTVIAKISVGSGAAGVAFTPDGSRAYVTNNGTTSVSVIDTATEKVIATVTVALAPVGVAITPDGSRAYVASNLGGSVSVIDTATNTVIATVGMTQPVVPAITPDGSRAYVTNNPTGSGFVAVIDTATNTVIATIGVGPNAQSLAITPDGTHAYVTCFGSNAVFVIDTATNTVTATVGVGSAPVGVAISPPQSLNPTTTTLASSLNPSVYGQTVTFTAHVTANSGTPTGTVQILNGTTVVGSGTLTNGSAAIIVSSLPAGSDSITAAYQGGVGFAPSTSAPLTQTVGIATTATALASSLNPAATGQPVTFTATVTSKFGGAATGSVVFFSGSQTLGTASLSGNHATLTTSFAAVGTYSISAKYNGDGNNVGSTSSTLSQVIIAATTTTLVSSLNPSLVGQAVTFTATVSSTAGAPPNGELVTFKNGSAILGTAPLSGGIASLTTSSLAAGVYTITASYGGDANFTASTSPGLRQVVNNTTKSTTSTTLVSSLHPSIYGQKVTWTATVTTSGPVPPTGSVTFSWSGYSIGTATLNASGVATLTKSNLNAFTYPLVAVYKGDTSNLGSTSAILNQVVKQATSAATLSSSPNPSTQGQVVTFTAKITSPTVTPTGPVTFTAGTKVLGTAQLSGGKATFTTSTLAVGSTTVTVTYPWNSNIAGSSASVTQVVNQ